MVSYRRQTGSRESLSETMKFTFEIDPVLMTLGILGVAWMTIRKDFFFALWIMPYIIFLGLISYSQYIHMVLLLPLFSIAAAILIQDSSNKLGSFAQSLYKLLSFTQIRGKLRHSLIPTKSTDTTKPSNKQQDLTIFLDTDKSKPPQNQQDLTIFFGNDYVNRDSFYGTTYC